MYRESVILDCLISARHQKDIEGKLLYLSDKIVDYTVIAGEQHIERIDFVCTEKFDVGKYLQTLIHKDYLNAFYIEEQTIWKSGRKEPRSYHAFDGLIDASIVFPVKGGGVTMGEPLVSLYNYLDGRIRSFVLSEMQAQEYIYPTVIAASVIEKCGYLHSAPQFLFFLNRLHNDLHSYNTFLNEYARNGALNDNVYRLCDHNIEYCLPPTMCYHTYDQFADTIREGCFVVTAKGKAFRNESRYAHTMERLMDFTIRETVFFGDYLFVSGVRDRFLNFIYGLVDELQLVGCCCSANDMFFMSDTSQYKIKMQKQMKSKLEIRLNINETESVAIGSVNYHDSYFSRAFNIGIRNIKSVVSGCTGFGLERFAYAFICQHGPDPAHWPIAI